MPASYPPTPKTWEPVRQRVRIVSDGTAAGTHVYAQHHDESFALPNVRSVALHMGEGIATFGDAAPHLDTPTALIELVAPAVDVAAEATFEGRCYSCGQIVVADVDDGTVEA